jgi:hypothetical protein
VFGNDACRVEEVTNAPERCANRGCDYSMMQVIASPPAVELIQERGGRLYVWLKRARCCGNVTTLVSSTSPPPRTQFRQLAHNERFELYVPSTLRRMPDELHVELRRFPRRVEAYWNGCAWVI